MHKLIFKRFESSRKQTTIDKYFLYFCFHSFDFIVCFHSSVFSLYVFIRVCQYVVKKYTKVCIIVLCGRKAQDAMGKLL